MFETSVVREGVRSRRRFSLFTVSVIAHTAVIAGAIGISIANTSFPTTAPDEFMNAPWEVPVTIPPPLGNPNGGAPPRPAAAPPAPQRQPQQQTAPAQETAPQDVPDDVPTLDAPSTGDVSGEPGDGRVPGPVGQPWGDPNGTGDLDAPPSPLTGVPAPEPEKIYTVGEVTAPVLVKRVDPVYPPTLVRVKLAGKAHVRCIIDKNGNVKNAQVMMATMPPFGDAAVRAVEQWRYKPASLNGSAVECYLDVLVDFSIR